MRTEKDTLVEQLREAVRGREREKALELLKKGALDGLTKEQWLEIYKSLMTLRNMEIIHYLAKQEEKFSSEMLRMDFEPYLNKNFVRQVLARYRKKFDLTDERECENLFEIACQANDPETVKYLIRQGRGKSRYALLGEAQMSVFQQCASIPQDALTQDAWMELFFTAAASEEGMEKMQFAADQKMDLSCVDSQGRSLEDLMERQIQENRYGRGRRESLRRTRDGQVLKLLRHLRQEREHPTRKPLSPKARAVLITVALVAAAVIIGYGVYFVPRWMEATGSGEDTTQENTTQGTDNAAQNTEDEAQSTNGADQGTDGADPGADTSEDSGDNAYNTDTSLVVADGDTVNIDYTGYVDDVPFDGGSTNGAGTSLTIGSGRYIDDFEEQLIGHHVGETVTVNVTFPEDYSSEELQGKDARFEVTINGIYE